MKATQQTGLVNGVVGGLFAGAIVAVWFLVVDLVAGDPFRTPAVLGATLFGQDYAGGFSTVTLYSLLHFGTFAIVGGVAGWLMAATGARPRILLGLFFGVCVLDGIHYTGLLLTGSELLTVLPWPHVVGANLLAGVVFMWFLHAAVGEARPLGIGALRDHPLIAEGLKVGLVGAAAVALWFLVVDIASGAPLRTPAALGSAVFLGASSAAEVAVTPAVVAAYTVLHLVVFGLLGIGFAAVARGVEQAPSMAYLTLLAAILLEAITFSTLVAFGSWVLGALSLWSIGVANLLAVAAMAGWLWRTHPLLRERVLRGGFASSP